MTHYHDVPEGDEYWMRCPWCFDSEKDPDKAHFSINVKSGKYYCYRCGHGGIFPVETLAQFFPYADYLLKTSNQRKKPVELHIEEILEPGLYSDRITHLDSFHVLDWDVFKSRFPNGDTIGFHFRKSIPKRSTMYGLRALGYTGKRLAPGWARIVEGPYDIVDPIHDVCCFGFPSSFQFSLLKGIPLLFCPDGDVWTSPKKKSLYLNTLFKAWSNGQFVLRGIEVIPGGKDPDEVFPRHRMIMPPEVIRSLQREWAWRKRPLYKMEPAQLRVFSEVLLRQV